MTPQFKILLDTRKRMAAARPGLFPMKADEHSHVAEVPGAVGGNREWRVAVAIFTPRRQAHELLRNAGDAKCPCGIGDQWRQHATSHSRGAAMPLRLAVLVPARGEANTGRLLPCPCCGLL